LANNSYKFEHSLINLKFVVEKQSISSDRNFAQFLSSLITINFSRASR
jgi:hypothetical protein